MSIAGTVIPFGISLPKTVLLALFFALTVALRMIIPTIVVVATNDNDHGSGHGDVW
jgi:hypothetical protein